MNGHSPRLCQRCSTLCLRRGAVSSRMSLDCAALSLTGLAVASRSGTVLERSRSTDQRDSRPGAGLPSSAEENRGGSVLRARSDADDARAGVHRAALTRLRILAPVGAAGAGFSVVRALDLASPAAASRSGTFLDRSRSIDQRDRRALGADSSSEMEASSPKLLRDLPKLMDGIVSRPGAPAAADADM